MEAKFNVNIIFADLYKEIKGNDTEQDLMRNINRILENNEVEMIIGIPSHQLKYAIENERLLDITSKINNIDNLHKGVIDRSLKMGDNKIFNISPIVSKVYVLFQNRSLLSELGVESLSSFISWNNFLTNLDTVQLAIDQHKADYFPLALSVKNANEDILFSDYDFQTHAFGLDSTIFEERHFLL